MKEFISSSNFHLLLFIAVAFLLYLFEFNSPYIFSQQIITPQSFIVQNFTSVIAPTSIGGVVERYEAKTNDVIVSPRSSDLIQLTKVPAYTETMSNITINEKFIFGTTPADNFILNSSATISKQSLLNGTKLG